MGPSLDWRRAGSTITDVTFLTLATFWPAAIGTRWHRWLANLRYRKLADRYDSVVIATDPEYGRPLSAAIAHQQRYGGHHPARIIDVGTGTGYAALIFAASYPAAQIVACDISADMLRLAALNATRAGRRIMLVRSSNHALPFQGGTFDLLTVHDALPAFREVARVLRPGGVLLACFSSGGAGPGWLLTALRKRLHLWGLRDVKTGRIGRGLFLTGCKVGPTTLLIAFASSR